MMRILRQTARERQRWRASILRRPRQWHARRRIEPAQKRHISRASPRERSEGRSRRWRKGVLGLSAALLAVERRVHANGECGECERRSLPAAAAALAASAAASASARIRASCASSDSRGGVTSACDAAFHPPRAEQQGPTSELAAMPVEHHALTA
eukprot:scaffold262378_cov28-Tisochrysis_lutea.AAC.1